MTDKEATDQENTPQDIRKLIGELEKSVLSNEAELSSLRERQDIVRAGFIEVSKLSFEAMKHLTTLSAGSILLMMTFLEKVFSNNREWTALIGGALIFFLLSIISAMSSLLQSSAVVTSFTLRSAAFKRRETIKRAMVTAAFITFILGVTCLCVFALKNLY